jgi:hypothetical protein
MQAVKRVIRFFPLFIMVAALAGCGGGGSSSSSTSTVPVVTFTGTITFNDGSTGTINFTETPATVTSNEEMSYSFAGPNGTTTTGTSVGGVGIGGTAAVTSSGTFSQDPLDQNDGLASITGTISGTTITGNVSDVQTSTKTTGDPTYPAFTGTYTATEDVTSAAIKAH